MMNTEHVTRYLFSFFLVGLAGASSACASRAPAPPTPPVARPPAPVVVAYSLRAGASGTVLSGRSDLSTSPLFASADEREAKSKTSLKLRGHREADGTVTVDAAYEERGTNVAIDWSPSVRLASPSHTVVELRGPSGWTRSLELTVE